MNQMFTNRGVSIGMLSTLGLLMMGVFAIGGCGKPESTTATMGDEAVTDVDLSHGGWWCVEHGVPEEECALCDKSLVSKFKEDNDWCDEHDRPESQCFICGPKRFEKFAAVYEAKTGQKPPQPTE